MKEVERIEDQLRRSLEGEAWHGPELLELLQDVSADEAAAKPLPSVHSICEISLHIIHWEELILSSLLSIADVSCRPSTRRQSSEEQTTTHQVVLPRAGVFVKHSGRQHTYALQSTAP
jgi:hypothetical protein